MKQSIDPQYSHTQIGWLSIIIMGLTIVSIISIMCIVPYNLVAFIIMAVVLAILVICLILFSFMAVTGNENRLEIRIGFIIRKNFPLKDIVSCEVIKLPWYYGWGIRITPDGWLCRVSGSDAVKINLRSGEQYLIGTDEPQNLAEFINGRLQAGT